MAIYILKESAQHNYIYDSSQQSKPLSSSQDFQTVIERDLTPLSALNYLSKLSEPLFQNIIGKAQESQIKTANEQQSQFRTITEYVMILDQTSEQDLIQHAQEIQKIFFGNLKWYPYDHSAISLRGSLEVILDPEVAASHDQEDTIDPVSGRRIQETLLETHFALRLGILPEKAESDYHEVYYLFSRFKEKLGVFKPREERYWYADRYGASEKREAHLSEVTSSMLDRRLGLGLIPYTCAFSENFCGFPPSPKIKANPTPAPGIRAGCYQLYVANSVSLFSLLEADDLWESNYDLLQNQLDTPNNRELKFVNFEQMAFLDLLLGDNDHHFKNILVKSGDEGQKRLVLIDNGGSFPWRHFFKLPFYKKVPLHQFKWSSLPQADRPFTDEMIKTISSLKITDLNEILIEALQDPSAPSSLDHLHDKMSTFHDRFSKIQYDAQHRLKINDIAQRILYL